MQRLRIGRFVLAVLLVAGALGYLVYMGTRDNLTYYYEIDELQAATGRSDEKIRIAGDVVAGSIVKNETTREVHFEIEKSASAAGRSVPVVYSGVLPDIFRPGIQVVVEGRLDPQGTFQAETLLAKCPSKYQAEGVLDAPQPSTAP